MAGTLELKESKERAHSNADVRSVAFSPDGKFIVSGSGVKTTWTRRTSIKVWDAGVSALTTSKQPFSPYLTAPVLAAATAWTRRTSIKVWEAGVSALTPSKQPFSPYLTAPVLAAASLELKAEKQGAHSSYVRSVAFSPDGTTIVSGSDDDLIKVWDSGVLGWGYR